MEIPRSRQDPRGALPPLQGLAQLGLARARRL
jgi:hypothetical protein